ncbi:MAG: GTPase HflX [Clostridia bacterium]|nr:GTPase HflX [Clostridia bacterium]
MTEKNIFDEIKTPDGFETENKCPEKAILVSVVLEDGDLMDPDSSLDELEALLETAGGTSCGRLIQSRQKPEHATYIGSGKLSELTELCHNMSIDLVVFDCELSPSQIRNVELALDGVRVIDRTMLILDIFAQRARTGEGILQVAIANLKYTLPRLSGQGDGLSRLGGGIGTRGPGETKLEVDRRHVKRKIQKLEEDLAELAKKRSTQRKSREKSGIFQISLAGYTNAGKSTLLNLLCQDNIFAEDKLFATLDPTTRRLRLPNYGEVLLTDTVGFINRLPHHLVEAFQSTLDEVVYSDLVLVVMDATDPKFSQKTAITEGILTDLYEKRGVTPPATLYVLNKTDCPESRFNVEAFPKNLEHVCISAKTGKNADKLIERIESVLSEAKKQCTFLIPHTEGGRLSYLYKVANVSSVEYLPEGILVEAVCDEKTRGSLSRFLKN